MFNGDVQSANRKISHDEAAIDNFVVFFQGPLFMAMAEIRTRLYIYMYNASCPHRHYNLQTWIDLCQCLPF